MYRCDYPLCNLTFLHFAVCSGTFCFDRTIHCDLEERTASLNFSTTLLKYLFFANELGICQPKREAI